METKRIIYLGKIPLSPRIRRDWLINHFQSIGCDVSYWDVAQIWQEENPEGDYSDSVITRFSTINEFKRSLFSLDGEWCVIFLLIRYELRYFDLFRLLKKANVKCLFFEWALIPEIPQSAISKAYNLVCSPSMLAYRTYQFFVNRIIKTFRLIKDPDWIFYAGMSAKWPERKWIRQIPFNMCDYERFRDERRNETQLFQQPYALFLDIFLPYQSDLKILGWPVISPQPYYDSLNTFFDFIEIKHGVKIVIAAHPKSNYLPETFCNRPIFKDKLPELVSNSSFILSHHSTSVCYAILALKPIIFFYTQEMLQAYKNTVIASIENFADYLRCPIYNIDADSLESVTIQPVNTNLYYKYKYEFLTSKECEEMKNTDIVIQTIFSRNGT